MEDFLNERIVKEISNLKDFISCINEIIDEKDKNSTKIYDNNYYINLQRTLELFSKFNNCVDNYDIYLTATMKNLIERMLKNFECLNNDATKYLVLKNKIIKFFYRGHYNSNYKLIPSVMRENGFQKELYREDMYYHNIMVQCSENFEGCNHIEQLVKMQHYDCPTRLLDITSNPLVALFFACKNFGCKKCNKADEGKVYVFPVEEQDILYYDSDRAKMLSCLPRFSYSEKKLIYDDCIKKIKGGQKFDASKNSNVIEKLYHEIRSETPSFDKKMDPLDLLSPFFVQPKKSNNRILKQDGAFIISGLSESSDEAEKKLHQKIGGEIKIHNQDKILKELDALGVNEATLFPEIDKVANYLKEKEY